MEKEADWRSGETVSEPFTIKKTEASDWRCQLFGTGNGGMVLIPAKGKEPNWFWRKMQYLILGNRWEKYR